MAKLGYYLIVFGIGSIILNSMGYEFGILSWMGEGVEIRLGIAGFGLLLVLLGSIGSKSPEEAESAGAESEVVEEHKV
jgi:hypothetical protein